MGGVNTRVKSFVESGINWPMKQKLAMERGFLNEKLCLYTEHATEIKSVQLHNAVVMVTGTGYLKLQKQKASYIGHHCSRLKGISNKDHSHTSLIVLHTNLIAEMKPTHVICSRMTKSPLLRRRGPSVSLPRPQKQLHQYTTPQCN